MLYLYLVIIAVFMLILIANKWIAIKQAEQLNKLHKMGVLQNIINQNQGALIWLVICQISVFFYVLWASVLLLELLGVLNALSLIGVFGLLSWLNVKNFRYAMTNKMVEKGVLYL